MDMSRRDDSAGARGVGVGVGGRLRQRLARMLLHSSCATTSATAFVGLATATATTNTAAVPRLEPPPPPPPPPRYTPPSNVGGIRCRQRHRRRGGGRAALLVHISIDCSARSVVGAAAILPSPIMPAARDAGAAMTAAATSVARRDKAKGKVTGDGSKSNTLRSSSTPLYGGWSSSTDDTDGERAPFRFSSEEADAAGSTTLVSFSSDSTASADFYYTNNTATGARPRRRQRQRQRQRHTHTHRRPPRRAPPPAPAAGDKAKKNEDGGAGGTAVVKRSVNPYADFRSSMAEMVAGRRVRGADALSDLLARYLALNSARHHPAILAAFEDVWEAVVLSDEP